MYVCMYVCMYDTTNDIRLTHFATRAPPARPPSSAVFRAPDIQRIVVCERNLLFSGFKFISLFGIFLPQENHKLE